MLLPLLPGCASAGRPADRAVRVAGLDPVALRKLGFVPRWISAARPLREGGLTQARVLGEAVLLVEGPDNVVTAADWGDGRQRWKKVIGLESEDLFAPVRREDSIYINSSGRVFELDVANGDLLKVDKLGRPVGAGGVLRNDLLIFGGVNGRLFAHSVTTSHTAWQYQMSGNISASPLLSDGNVFVADTVGTYGMFDADTGDLVWRNHTFGPVTAAPVLHRGDVLVPSEDRSLYALDRATGADSWIFRATRPLKVSPLSVGRDVYLPVPGGGLIGIDNRGEIRWSITLDATPVLASDRGIYAVTEDGLVLLDPASGEVLAGTRTGAITATEATEDGSLLMVFADGRLLRLDPAG
ncbi:hypothetical protein PSMK_23000 [Phycisphaera mikurensis NBRC 102666]|uniref:Pyrrolo-quinoline quinone repeat domain-containing protein n=1 Tax=Phycisphaera mikurensis (strain NBRC 102666 / KCTC 22515 / FYK2301M01) TaxID=1142394 RepID=I0IGS1_PHYMF|nr:hypothetical protein PSMK_23000 [Phycisphaera mikurensis NBRC 102666]